MRSIERKIKINRRSLQQRYFRAKKRVSDLFPDVYQIRDYIKDRSVLSNFTFRFLDLSLWLKKKMFIREE